MYLIAYEGPSGSGKGYNVAKLAADEPHLWVMERPTFGRVLENWEGAWTSSYLEYQAVAAAVMGVKNVLVDRFLISRWVYRAMQFGHNTPPEYCFEEMSTSFRNMVRMAIDERTLRLHGMAQSTFRCQIRVLLPTLDELQRRRALSGKQYPFDAVQELALYRFFAVGLRDRPTNWLEVVICS